MPHANERTPQLASVESDSLLDSVIDQSWRASTAPVRTTGIAIGRLSGFNAQGKPLVDIPVLGITSQAAASLTLLRQEQIGESLAIAFEGDDPLRPIVLGQMMTPSQAPEAPSKEASLASPVNFNAVVDGQHVLLQAEHEIELRCGDAAILLSSDGRITLRGTYITSYASATQRILGGSVNVN